MKEIAYYTSPGKIGFFIIVCESRREKRLPEVPAPYRMKRQRAYGKIMLTLYEREAD